MTSRIADIKAVARREETVLRLGGDGYGAALTWAADDQQLVAFIDGAGWPRSVAHDYYCSCLFDLGGSPKDVQFKVVQGYPDIPLWDFINGSAPYYGLNLLAVDDCIYQYLSTDERIFSWVDKASWSDLNFTSVKLIYSPDNGRTWCNQDGSTPVRREAPRDQSNDNMVFFHEPQGCFSQLSFLQMGRGYRDNCDGYVYVYGPNGIKEGTMNELVLFRVPKARILDRNAYEYFEGLRSNGSAHWTPDINARGVVHLFPTGRVPSVWPLAWLPSVVYNAPLGLYMMANSSGIGADCLASEASYLGIWVSVHPWGPWRQLYEEPAWKPGGDGGARAASPQIAPKWIAADGKSFWLVWTDVQQSTRVDRAERRFHTKEKAEWKQGRAVWREDHPYFAFNIQRVDLDLA